LFGADLWLVQHSRLSAFWEFLPCFLQALVQNRSGLAIGRISKLDNFLTLALLLCVVIILSAATFLGMFSESVEECFVRLAQGCFLVRSLR